MGRRVSLRCDLFCPLWDRRRAAVSALTLCGFVLGAVGVPIPLATLRMSASRGGSIATSAAADRPAGAEGASCFCPIERRSVAACCCRKPAAARSCCATRATDGRREPRFEASPNKAVGMAPQGVDESPSDSTDSARSVASCPCGTSPLELIHVSMDPRMLPASVAMNGVAAVSRVPAPSSERAAALLAEPAEPPPRAA